MTAIKEMVGVMLAFSEVKEIEHKINHSFVPDKWNYTDSPTWNWAVMSYRVKREPREFGVLVTPEGIPLGVASPGGCIPVQNTGSIRGATVIKVREVLE